ncbi:unnamed protein product [Plutella xylostella]|uniref:(diamondback moth) hypothetical protein n=1 Tax=Plutella xylostella TaxID=51655 RepID=A0A8S4G4V5_PLUXY|nr:unnamed protein product [Plutella xylostella]
METPKVNVSTPMNTVSRENLAVLIRNNTIMNDSVEFVSDCDVMETDSPVRKPLATLQHINKKLFHSPRFQNCPAKEVLTRANSEGKRAKKRKQCLVPNSNEPIKRAFVKECDKDGYSPEPCDGMRKRVLISLFHNKEYSMDYSE